MVRVAGGIELHCDATESLNEITWWYRRVDDWYIFLLDPGLVLRGNFWLGRNLGGQERKWVCYRYTMYETCVHLVR